MKEILVLGAGYAGLKAVRNLQKQSGDFHITLVDMNDYHYEATELHEVAAGSQPKEKLHSQLRMLSTLIRLTSCKMRCLESMLKIKQ